MQSDIGSELQVDLIPRISSDIGSSWWIVSCCSEITQFTRSPIETYAHDAVALCHGQVANASLRDDAHAFADGMRRSNGDNAGTHDFGDRRLLRGLPLRMTLRA